METRKAPHHNEVVFLRLQHVCSGSLVVSIYLFIYLFMFFYQGKGKSRAISVADANKRIKEYKDQIRFSTSFLCSISF